MKSLVKSARDALSSKEFTYALQLCNDGLELEPNNYHLLVFKASALEKLNQFDKAIETYQKACHSEPKETLALIGLASLYEKQAKWKDYEQCLEQVATTYLSEKNDKKIKDVADKLEQAYIRNGKKEAIMGLRLKIVKTIPSLEAWLEIEELERDRIQSTLKKEREMKTIRPADWSFEKFENSLIENSILEEIYDSILALSFEEKYEILLIEHLYRKLKELCPSRMESSLSVIPFRFSLELQDSWKESFASHSSKSKTNDQFMKLFSSDSIPNEEFKNYVDSLGSIVGYEIFADKLLACNEHQKCLVYVEKVEEKVKFYSSLNLKKPQTTLRNDLRKALCYQALGPKFIESSMILLESILERDPSQLQALLALGKVMMDYQNYDKARSYFNEVLKRDSENAEVLGWQAQACLSAMRFDEARDCIEKALVLQPSIGRYHFIKGKLLWSEKEKETAVNSFIIAAKLDPNYCDTFIYLGHFYLEKDDTERAAKCYSKAYSIDPNKEEATISLCKLMLSQKMSFDVIEILESFVEYNNRSFQAFKLLGFIFLSQNPAKASIYFQNALRSNAEDYLVWDGLGDAYGKEGKYLAAIKAYQRSLSLNGNQFNPKMQIAILERKLGNYESSIANLKALLDNEIWRKDYHYNILARLSESCFECSKSAFEELCDGKARTNLSSALSFCMQAISLNPSFKFTWELMAEILFFMHRKFQIIIDESMFSQISAYSIEVASPLSSLLEKVESFLRSNVDESNTTLIACCHAIHNTILLSLLNSSAEYLSDLALILSLFDFDISKQVISAAIGISSSNPKIWQVCGIVNFSKDVTLAQHSFITALEIDSRSAQNWNNLGFLYLLNGDCEIASACFTKSQILKPDDASSWLGHTLVAQITGANIEDALENCYEIFGGRNELVNLMWSQMILERNIRRKELKSEEVCAALFSLKRSSLIYRFHKEAKALVSICHELNGNYSTALNILSENHGSEEDILRLKLCTKEISSIDEAAPFLSSNSSLKMELLYHFGQFDKIEDLIVNSLDSLCSAEIEFCFAYSLRHKLELCDKILPVLAKAKTSSAPYLLSVYLLLNGNASLAFKSCAKRLILSPFSCTSWGNLNSLFSFNCDFSTSHVSSCSVAIFTKAYKLDLLAEGLFSLSLEQAKDGHSAFATRSISKALFISPWDCKLWLQLVNLRIKNPDVTSLLNGVDILLQSRPENESFKMWHRIFIAIDLFLRGDVRKSGALAKLVMKKASSSVIRQRAHLLLSILDETVKPPNSMSDHLSHAIQQRMNYMKDASVCTGLFSIEFLLNHNEFDAVWKVCTALMKDSSTPEVFLFIQSWIARQKGDQKNAEKLIAKVKELSLDPIFDF